MFGNDVFAPPARRLGGTYQSPWASARVGGRLDSELAIQLRCLLRPEFDEACSWNDLRRALWHKGFGVKFEHGRLRLIDSLTRVDICSTGFLGFPLGLLEQKLGAPVEEALWNHRLLA